MRIVAMVVCLFLCIAGSIADAQAVRNSGFDTNLQYWMTWYSNPPGQQRTAGSAEWDPAYGGSARLTVDGTPGNIGLVAPICDTLFVGDSAWIDVTVGNMQYATVALWVGDYDGGNGQYAQLVEPARGEYRLRILAERKYVPGTLFALGLTSWPGACTCWVGTANAALEEGQRVQPKQRSDLAVRPNPSGASTEVSFLLARASSPTLSIYDAAGRCVRQMSLGRCNPGALSVGWDGRDEDGDAVAEGAYLVRLDADGTSQTARVVRTK